MSAASMWVEDDSVLVGDFMYAQGWTDGLPVMPVTRDRVRAMVAATGRDADEVIAEIPPNGAAATIELIAANAVLAGCEPTAAPVVVAAVEAIAAPAFNLLGVQATTHPCGVVVLVSGPAATAAGIHGGEGCLGPGFRTNLTIGRAVRLVMSNIGGARPGTTDRATQGTPAKLSLCFTENVDASPWEPFHVAEGFDADESVVTVMAAEGPHNINDHWSVSADGLLDTIGGAMRNIAGNNFTVHLRQAWGEPHTGWHPRPIVVLGVEHAALLGAAGLSRADVQTAVWERARVELDAIPREWRARIVVDAPVPVTDRPDQIAVVVAGGVGKHSCWIPSLSSASMVSARIAGPIAGGVDHLAGNGGHDDQQS